jgi:hypothetical protein
VSEVRVIDRCAAACCAGSTSTPRAGKFVGFGKDLRIARVMAVASAARRAPLRLRDL